MTEGEGNLLRRTHLLIVWTIVLILALTLLCVLATMAALAMERRQDVGLMKALGGSISRIVTLFLAEVGILGAAEGDWRLDQPGGVMRWRVGWASACSPRQSAHAGRFSL